MSKRPISREATPPIPAPPTVPPLSPEGMLIPAALVAPKLKILYLPTTKAACTALKFLLAEAEGSLNTKAIETLTTAAVTRAHTIHNPIVSGLKLFRELEPDEQQHILQADDWWRVGAIRNPYARMYSSWENRVLMRAPSSEIGTYESFEDVLVDDCIDLGATFALFMDKISEEPFLVNQDDHFRSQADALRPGVIGLTHVLQVEKDGELADFAGALGKRANKPLQLKRLNEGLRVHYTDVVSARAAMLIEQWWQSDFADSTYPIQKFPENLDSVVLTSRETKMVRYIREVSTRLGVVATELQTKVSELEQQVHEQWLVARERQGARYGAREIIRRLRR